jgi:hypothetical protein
MFSTLALEHVSGGINRINQVDRRGFHCRATTAKFPIYLQRARSENGRLEQLNDRLNKIAPVCSDCTRPLGVRWRRGRMQEVAGDIPILGGLRPRHQEKKYVKISLGAYYARDTNLFRLGTRWLFCTESATFQRILEHKRMI